MPQTPGLAPGASVSSTSILPGRLVTLALIFAVELVALSVWLDNAALAGRGAFAGFAGAWGAWILRGIVGFCFLFATFAWLRYRPALNRLSGALEGTPVSPKLLTSHFAVLGAFFGLSSLIYGTGLRAASLNATIILWLFAGVAAIILAGLAFLRPAHWACLVTVCGRLWIYALLAVVAACVVGNEARLLWAPSVRVTFHIVYAMLRPFLSGLAADASKMSIGTPRFAVEIAPECSGFEGAGLILAFGVLWLLLFRSECRFPRALLLIPAALVLLFLLNSVRIAALILLGNAGAERLALGGFHSQAGWIAFNGVALGFCAAARRIPWFTNRSAPIHGVDGSPRELPAINPVAPWVMPFVTILAAGMLSRALTADFEWSYPLRFFAAAAALWFFRAKYRTLDWRFGWPGIAAGALVFVVWIGMERVFPSAPEAMPQSLALASSASRAVWILIRALAATVTVAIAEELAFRGFLLRRLVSEDFESVDFTRVPWFALAVSSVVFGLLHDDRWIAGTLAGLVYGLALQRRGRIGDAVVAHGLTNALLAAWVLIFHQWQLW